MLHVLDMSARGAMQRTGGGIDKTGGAPAVSGEVGSTRGLLRGPSRGHWRWSYTLACLDNVISQNSKIMKKAPSYL